MPMNVPEGTDAYSLGAGARLYTCDYPSDTENAPNTGDTETTLYGKKNHRGT